MMILNNKAIDQLAKGEKGISVFGKKYKFVRTAAFPACSECDLAFNIKCRSDVSRLCSALYLKRRPGNDFMPVPCSSFTEDKVIDLDNYITVLRI